MQNYVCYNNAREIELPVFEVELYFITSARSNTSF